jgi:hypothetical protein
MIEEIFESLLNASAKFKELLSNFENLAKNIVLLSETVFKLSQTILTHDELIRELVLGYQTVVDALTSMHFENTKNMVLN